LYDSGKYDEARAALIQLDAAGGLDGPSLYRLFFCEKAAGHEDDSRKALDRARLALEAEAGSSPSLEIAFYLANAYANLGRAADAQRVARDMTDRVEFGKVATPTSGIGFFQLGKLYQDQARQNEASSFYAKSADAFDLHEGRYVGNARWALRYLGNNAFARADFAASESALARLTAIPGAEAIDWDALAAARTRLGKYTEAAVAWNVAVKLDPANADDPRYAARLAEAAGAVAPLPVATPEAAPFKSMSQSDLEAFLKTCLESAKTAQSRAADLMRPESEGKPPRALDPKLRAELTQSLLVTRRQLVAAGLEYAVRRYGIRETAFRDGYAILIFQDRAWELPPDPAGGS
jgi:tetratricopeptide (TPR) repeat protein